MNSTKAMPSTAHQEDDAFVISRVVAAPRSRVWKAWTDAKELKKWWGPNAELSSGAGQIILRFVYKLISVARDSSGAVIEGNAEKVTDVTDVWTFARDVSSRDPNWKVVATEAGQ